MDKLAPEEIELIASFLVFAASSTQLSFSVFSLTRETPALLKFSQGRRPADALPAAHSALLPHPPYPIWT